MAKLVALYKTPSDPTAFDAHYFSKHVPLAKTISGLQRYQVSAGPVATPQGASPYYLAAILSFDSMDSLQQALSSPEGKATASDLANFAQAGVELLVFDTKDV
ncbi:EthD family reductase [Paraburkholderia aromaticivorans]|uniref:EthD like-protein n=1 Tax=Paraburkholderia aromaticivorans TaxID=2026199 RepID=A0A248VIX9_9BURK|nr:EthD family reductase [Paraburkholderia aromaticivorans]ASV98794.1 ethD like-protein [Paraburkholderia aromaticivorans]